ncbi:MAG: hypothetical protein EPO08_16275 [Rhodospirillaceae bacterium]|nr:MAG: hypothetical protein EPO08_16275 [Rhodospirillaceae bacterium]
MANEAHKLLEGILERLQKNAKVRTGLAVCAVLGLLGIAGSFLYDFLPQQYALSITGGDILSSRHFIARVLQQEAANNGVALRLYPMSGSQEALMALNEGKLDLAFIQGGLENKYPNVRHVAYIAPEQLQLLVRPEIKDISGLRSKLVNLGSRLGGTRIVAKEVLQFSGLNDGVEYVETNFSTEELLHMRDDKLPDAVMVTAIAPTDIAEYLVKERGYNLLEIPFPASLALRYGWVADAKILAYTYNVTPPVPGRDIRTIGVNMDLVANKDVEPRAIFRVLESLYSPALAVRTNVKIDENQLTTPSGYPLSEGSQLFLARKNPLLSSATLDKIKALVGLSLSMLSTALVAFRWFRGEAYEPPKPPADDPVFVAWINDVAAIEQQFEATRSQSGKSPMPPELVDAMQTQLSTIKAEALCKLGAARLDNALLPQALLLAIADARARIHQTAV